MAAARPPRKASELAASEWAPLVGTVAGPLVVEPLAPGPEPRAVLVEVTTVVGL